MYRVKLQRRASVAFRSPRINQKTEPPFQESELEYHKSEQKSRVLEFCGQANTPVCTRYVGKVGLQSLQELPRYDLRTEGREILKKDTGHARWVGGRCNEQGNLHAKLVLSSSRVSRSSHISRQILKVF